jgi:hypothetical protein
MRAIKMNVGRVVECGADIDVAGGMIRVACLPNHSQEGVTRRVDFAGERSRATPSANLTSRRFASAGAAPRTTSFIAILAIIKARGRRGARMIGPEQSKNLARR